MDLEIYRSAVFDCDGVILDSNQMKSEAFRKALEGEEATLVDEFLDYHHANGGISRSIKFRHFFHDMKQVDAYEFLARKAMERYSRMTREGLMTCGEIPGVRKLLDFFQDRDVRCFVISGGDEEEVQTTFSKRGFAPYFRKILGSPTPKSKNLDLIRSSGLFKEPGIYFGDAQADMETAKMHGLDFVFVAGKSEWKAGREVCRLKNLPIIEDFSQIPL